MNIEELTYREARLLLEHKIAFILEIDEYGSKMTISVDGKMYEIDCISWKSNQDTTT
jgi:hypothetical protein